MIILCSKCGERFESLIIDRELAFKEIFNTSCRHVKTKHAAMFMEMSKAVAICINAMTTFMHMNEFVVVPEEEKYMQELLEQEQDIIMAAIGFDPGEDDEEETEDELDDGETVDPIICTIDLPEGSNQRKNRPEGSNQTNY